MVKASDAVRTYLDGLEPSRREGVSCIRDILLAGLPDGFQEEMQYRMPSYTVPLHLYPAGYHCDPKLSLPFVALAANKGGISLYHMGLYADSVLMDWFLDRYQQESSLKPDVGKSCIRFRKTEDIPVQTIRELAGRLTPADWIARYEDTFRKK
jgi:hypothetical protein